MCDETESKSKNSINSILQYVYVVRKDCFVVFTASRFPYVILRPNFMTAQSSKGKVPRTYNDELEELTFQYEKLLLLK